MSAAAHAELLDLLDELVDACPRPTGGWHPGESHIDALFADYNAARETLAKEPEALTALADELDAEEDAGAPQAEGALAEALARVGHMPRPQGMHPYVDAIAPVVDALAAALRAIARTPAATAVFEAQRLVATHRSHGPHVDAETLDRIRSAGA